MTPDLFRRARDVFDEAIELEAEERDEFLKRACDAPALREEVDALLRESEGRTLADGVREAIRDLTDPGTVSSQGRRVGPYELVREIGRGGMGTVYLARRADDAFEKEVALKLVRPGMDTTYFLKRFREERQILASLQHPNIATLLDGGTTEDGLPYFVMERIEGRPIDAFCAETGSSLDGTLRLFLTACAAVQHAHQRLIVHRDLKPSNILVTEDGVPKLLDFGLARLLTVEGDLERTATGYRALTPAYASPEQMRGERVTTSSDVYSLGVVLYGLITGGRRPYRPVETDDDTAHLRAVLTEEPLRPALAAPEAHIPKDLEAIVLKALRKEPEERYRTAGALAEDIGRLLDGRPIGARPDSARYKARRYVRRHRAGLAAAAVASLSLAASGLVLWRSRSAHDESRPPTSSTTTTLAVLPFRPLVASEGDAVLELGMADTLITKLSGVPGIALRPLSAVQRQTKDGADAVGVGRIVRADAVVEGSLQHVRDRLRVTVRLIAVADGHAMWGETFDTDATDVFAVQDAIAQRVAASLKPHLSSEARAGLGRRGTADLAAYNAYLKGRYFWNRRTEADFRKAIGHFKQAIAADPTYALAHSGLADCYSLLSIWGAAPPKETLDEARLAASRAVAAAGDSFGEPYASAALVRWIYEWDWEGADSAFGRAIALNPSYATAHQWYAYYLASRGRFDEAIARIRRAQELDPLSVSIATDVGEIHCWGGRYDEALAHIGAALDMEPNFPLAHNVLGTIQLKRGRVAEAIEELERAFRMDDSPRFVATLGHAYGVANRRADARAMEARLSALEKTRYISRFHLALIAAGLGEDDRAFTLLDQAFRERSDNMAILRVHPLLEKLRGDPRFDELMRRVDSSAD